MHDLVVDNGRPIRFFIYEIDHKIAMISFGRYDLCVYQRKNKEKTIRFSDYCGFSSLFILWCIPTTDS